MTNHFGRTGVTRFGTIFMALGWALLVFGFGYFSEYTDKPSEFEYSMFQDVHVMVYIGFGFLMVFLRRNSLTATGHTLLLAAFAVVFAFFSHYLWYHIIDSPRDNETWNRLKIGIDGLVTADFCAASFLIAFGAVIGRVTIVQCFAMVIGHVTFYNINEAIAYTHFGVADVGGSMTIHVFGAYFGLMVSMVLETRNEERKKLYNAVKKNDSDRTSDTMAMVGTVFLWCFWPSFNAFLGGTTGGSNGVVVQRSVVNTYLSLCASTVATFLVSAFRNKGKVNMVDVQNATLAGGVAMGAAANMLPGPWGALIIGTFAGTISTLGFNHLTPFLEAKIGLQDTCGVHNLHGMPGITGALVSIVLSGTAAYQPYHNEMSVVWPLSQVRGNSYRTLIGFQFATLFVTLGIALLGGLVTGLIIRQMGNLTSFFDDAAQYVVHDEVKAEGAEMIENQLPAGASEPITV